MLNDPLVRDRASEFPLLQRETYLDHAGSSLFSASQFNSATKELSGFLPRNPHSSPNEKIHECRLKVLEFLGASNDYVTVFNSGSSGGLSSLGHILLLGDPNIKFYYLDESHTSLVGLRELSGSYDCFSREDMDSLDSQFFGDEETSLIAFPAMSNFCGYKFPFEDWIRKIRLIENQEKRKIYILLDTASYASNNQLDLSAESGIDPDFVVLSFYKIFGYPTGVGALVLKDECLKTLLRMKKYFGGGTVQMSHVRRNQKVLKMGVQGLEDGTLPFQQITSSIHGFNLIKDLKMTKISAYTFSLAQKCFQELRDMTYTNGAPLVKFNLTHKQFDDPQKQGSILNFQLLNPDGTHAGFSKFAYLCSAHRIHIRVGCFCNMGACSRYLGLSEEDIEGNFRAGHSCGDDMDLIDGRPLGSIRISFGYYNELSDISKVVSLLRKYYLEHPGVERRSLMRSGCVVLRNIFLYPVKSCGPMSVEKWPVRSSGLLYDRQWLVLHGNKILSQKNEALLALITPRIDLHEGYLSLSFKNHEPRLRIDLRVPSSSESNFISCVGKVCNESFSGFDEGKEASLWLEDCLGLTGLKLIRLCRRSSMNNLANSGEFLILNWSSLLDLTVESSSLDPEWMMRQFRANLVFDSSHVYEEHQWMKLRSKSDSKLSLEFKESCKRCKMLNIDQDTAQTSQEPMSSLSKISRTGIEFGILASCSVNASDVNLRVGECFVVSDE